MSFKSFAAGLCCTVLLLGASSPSRAQSEEYVWSFYQYDETASLIFGIPETDAVRANAVCEGGAPSLKLEADVGGLSNGEAAEVKFSAGSFSETLPGEVIGIGAEMGIAGVEVKPSTEDGLWQAIADQETLTYEVSGHRASDLSLKGAEAKVEHFLAACNRLGGGTAEMANDEQEAAQTMAEQDPIEAAEAPASEISEKEAFESAKELGTVEAWDAFLSSFPTGFRADLARAYLAKLGSAPPAKLPAEPTPKEEAAAAEPEIRLSTVNPGPGTSAWVNFDFPMDEGNSSVFAASVQAPGIQFITYCNANKKLSMKLQATPHGVYPAFDTRISQGLETAIGTGSDPDAGRMLLQFSNGASVATAARVEGMTGDVVLNDPANAKGFVPAGATVKNFLTENSVILSAPPFQTTLQLKGSKTAICAVLNRCGASAPDCAAEKAAPKPAAKPKPKPKNKSGCGAGQIKVEGRCMTPSDAVRYCGPGYKAVGGRCVQRQSAPAQPQCPPGLVWSALEGCHEDD
ncbi:hypothetical protein V6C03_04610 [Methyloligella sp. 2.7D]|uniref:hypothetical protein n=1 Tax=unclassified Methyloligella TaxID=2625955 RepID=UPI00157C5165|nr:hypothetical protein [Methyloligella sp. GL2]QKP76123.1 hypothetical protein HT051_00820 [Methyloligella sp. GL2]